MKLFGSLFTPEDPLIALARSGDIRTFVESFLSSEIFVVSSPIQRTLDPANVTAEELTELTEEAQALCFLAGANSIFVGDELLTTPNPEPASDAALLAKLGLEAVSGGR